jgi:hypothetical protein
VLSLIAADASEAHIQSAGNFLEGVYGDGLGYSSRATTPMTVGSKNISLLGKKNIKHDVTLSEKEKGLWQQWNLLGLRSGSISTESQEQNIKQTPLTQKEQKKHQKITQEWQKPSRSVLLHSPQSFLESKTKLCSGNAEQDISYVPRRNLPQRPSALPTIPDISSLAVEITENMEYAVLVSMYEVYNDRIFDLLSHPRSPKDSRRRPLLFKSTEGSPDRKVVAGLKL